MSPFSKTAVACFPEELTSLICNVDRVDKDSAFFFVASRPLRTHSEKKEARRNHKGKTLHYLPQFLRKYAFPPWTLKLDKPPPWTFKTVRFTSLTSYKRFQRRFCIFIIFFISAESLKIYSKSHKNHEMETSILLDSTWVDLHNEHIIWYALLQFFCYSFRSMLFYN